MLSIGRNRSFKAVGVPLLHFFFFFFFLFQQNDLVMHRFPEVPLLLCCVYTVPRA